MIIKVTVCQDDTESSFTTKTKHKEADWENVHELTEAFIYSLSGLGIKREDILKGIAFAVDRV